jgi:NADH-quinone oxidoreductase subunit N
VLGLVSRGEQEPHFLSDFAGLGFTHPVPAFVLTLCLASLAGIPPLVGFAGKFFLFYSAVAAGQMTLAVIGILNSILSVYYYIRVIYTLYMREPGRAPVIPARSLSATAGLILLGFLILLLGLLPGGLDEASARAAGALWGLYVQ